MLFIIDLMIPHNGMNSINNKIIIIIIIKLNVSCVTVLLRLYVLCYVHSSDVYFFFKKRPTNPFEFTI